MTSPAKCLTRKWSSFPRFSALPILGAPKTAADFLPCASCRPEQKALPVALGALQAESSSLKMPPVAFSHRSMICLLSNARDCCCQWQSVAISGNQWQSVAISGSQWQSTYLLVVLVCDWRPCDALCADERRSKAIRGDQGRSEAIRGDQNHSHLLLVRLAFVLKDGREEELLKLLVRKVDAQLLERVHFEELEAVSVGKRAGAGMSSCMQRTSSLRRTRSRTRRAARCSAWHA